MSTMFLDITPAVPPNYFRLEYALAPDELNVAVAYGYILSNRGILESNYRDIQRFDIWKRDGSIENWRNRMFLVWFCYLFEIFYNFERILGAIELLISEFQGGPDVFYDEHFEDPNNDFVSEYAGINTIEPATEEKLRFEYKRLEPHYKWSQRVLADYKRLD